MISVGMFNQQCKDCGKNCSPKMLKGIEIHIKMVDVIIVK